MNINIIIDICFSLAIFILIISVVCLIMYVFFEKNRKAKKIRIQNYVIQQAKQWSYDKVKKYKLQELYTCEKMYNTGVGNDASDLRVKNYAANTQWLLKM